MISVAEWWYQLFGVKGFSQNYPNRLLTPLVRMVIPKPGEEKVVFLSLWAQCLCTLLTVAALPNKFASKRSVYLQICFYKEVISGASGFPSYSLL